MNINHATKAGVTVHEYRVLENGTPLWNRNLTGSQRNGCQRKKSGLLQFTMEPSASTIHG